MLAEHCRLPLRASRIAIVLLIIAPLLVKLPLLLGLLHADPMLLFSGLAQGLHSGPAGGYPPYPTIDPNIAFTSHALGHRAALDVLHGHMPWWNYYEGVGAPLAGEMQSSALFPLTWLLYFSNGQLYMHLALQIIAGLSTYGLLRKLQIIRTAALAAALVFEFNGTFAWLADVVVNPIPFLPLALLGVEHARERAMVFASGGGVAIALALAASLYAGFPEVAYLNGLLVFAWTLVRIPSLPPRARWRFLLKVGMGGFAALAIAAPVLVAFIDYLQVAMTGMHEGEGLAHLYISPTCLVALAVPYAFGSIFGTPALDFFWGNIGGYIGCTLFVLAFAGMWGANYRGVRLMLGLWVLLSLAVTFGIPGGSWLVQVIPAMKLTAFYRYLPPSWEMALCILAAFGLSDLRTHDRPASMRTGVILLLVFIVAGRLIASAAGVHAHGRLAHDAWLFCAVLLITLIGSLFVRITTANKIRGLSALLVLEAVIYFTLPVLSYPSQGRVDLGGVRFLQAHAGLQRFVTLGPIAPNYGSYFGIAAINHNDIPLPRDWTEFVAQKLDDNSPPVLFLADARIDPKGRSAADNLARNIDNYRAIGVKYLVTASTVPLAPALTNGAPGFEAGQGLPREVYRDDTTKVFDLGAAKPYFTAPGCTLAIKDRAEVAATCGSAANLTRLELFMPGWHAEVNGLPATLTRTGSIFQQLALPAGTSRITFHFEPPYIVMAYAAFAIGWLMLVLMYVPRRGAEAAQAYRPTQMTT